MIILFILENRGRYGVREMCEVLKVSESSYYRFNGLFVNMLYYFL